MTILSTLNKIKPKNDVINHTYLSLKNSYIYTAVGKAANSTVKHHLYGLEYAGTRFEIMSLHDRRCSPLLSPFQLSETDLDRIFSSDDFFKFSFVRNPYSRLLSCYLDRIVPKKSGPYNQLLRYANLPKDTDISFTMFIETICKQTPYEMNNHWRIQTDEICLKAIDYNFIGKIESFSEDMSTVWKNIAPGVKKPNFNSENKAPSVTSARNKLLEYYDSDLISLVSNKYRDDFESFDYSTDISKA